MHNVFIPLVLNTVHLVPTCTISLLRDNVLVIRFSERVVNFTESDIELTGGTLSNFIGNGTDYCITIETETTAEVFVPAHVCESVHGIANAYSNRFTYNA
ncbi:hypothetical protein F4X90_20240 [Candidatus Poribacteria bacterium]|nr:hypothetical protein [Candidatus Poribacteria bacterium]